MTSQHEPHNLASDSSVYEIRVTGHLDPQWASSLEEVAIYLEDNGETRLTCPAADQAALHGLLRKVRDLGLTLVAVTRLPAARD